MPPQQQSTADTPEAPEIDAAGVDRAQIRAMLALSPEERLRLVEGFLDSVAETREANEASASERSTTGGATRTCFRAPSR